MKTIHKILLIGGDKRTAVIEHNLRKTCPETEILSVCAEHSPPESASSEEIHRQAEDADVLILPLPLCTDGENMTVTAEGVQRKLPLRPFLEALSPGKLILGGQIPYFYKRLIEECGSVPGDYFDSESVQLRNAVPTAEGALGIAVTELPVTVAGCPIVITGYGRCGYALASRLHLLGADVTVSVRRREAQIMAEVDGCRSIPLRQLQTDPPRCRMLFNTIPAPILTADTLRKLPDDCILTELASGNTSGLETEAKKAGLRYIRAAGLPGKTAPETAGNILTESILEWIGNYRGEAYV